MKLLLITPNSFPSGNVATTRYKSYCLALGENGVDVKILVLAQAPSPNTVPEGHWATWRGVHYQYLPHFKNWGKLTRARKLLAFARALLQCLKVWQIEKPNAVLLYSHDIPTLLVFGLMAKLSGTRLIMDRSEYPSPFKPSPRSVGRRRATVTYWFYVNLHRLPSAFIVMTEALGEYYGKLIGGRTGIFHLPMTIDLDSFEAEAADSSYGEQYVACTFGSHGRDSIEDTIASFELLLSRWKDCPYRLLLAGPVDLLKNGRRIRECVEASPASSKIELLGSLPQNQVPTFLLNATVCITTAREYVSGGFPTKLGEYFATSKPVLCTAAGDIPKYVTDRVHASLAEPGNLGDISNRLQELLHDPNLRQRLGKNGRLLAESTFSSRTYVAHLKQFLFNETTV